MSKALAVITGCSSGLGAVLVRQFIAKNVKVIAVVRDKSNSGAISDLKIHPQLTVMGIDVSDFSACEQISNEIEVEIERGYRLDAVIFNAGVCASFSVSEGDMASARAMMEVNFFSVLNCLQRIVPMMRRQGSGKLLAISSLSAHIGLAGDCAYAASKAALERLFESLSCELKDSGVYSGVLVPGAFASNLNKPASTMELETVEEVAARALEFIEADLEGFLAPGNVQAAKVLGSLAGATPVRRQALALEWSDS